MWRKSTFCYNGSSCLEVDDGTPGMILVRDSKDPDGSVLRFTPDEWRAFLERGTFPGLAS